MRCYVLTRWKKDETEFNIALSFDGTNSKRCRIPKPVLSFLGDPDSLKISLKNGKAIITSGDKQ